MHVHGTFAAHIHAQLPQCFEEGLAFDVADCAADLNDHHVGFALFGNLLDAPLNLVGDVRDDLNGATEKIAAPLLTDHVVVNLSGGNVARLRQIFVNEALVMPQVQVRFGPVSGHAHLAMLERTHRARVNVQVGIEFLDADLQPARFQNSPYYCRRPALAYRTDDAPRTPNLP